MKIWNLRNFTEIKWREFLISHYCLFWALRVRVLANLRIKETLIILLAINQYDCLCCIVHLRKWSMLPPSSPLSSFFPSTGNFSVKCCRANEEKTIITSYDVEFKTAF